MTALALAASAADFDVPAGGTTTVATALSQSDGLNKTGEGTLVLTNSANSYTGNTVVHQGVLRVGSGVAGTFLGAPSAAGTGNLVTVNDGATLQLIAGSQVTAKELHLRGGGASDGSGGNLGAFYAAPAANNATRWGLSVASPNPAIFLDGDATVRVDGAGTTNDVLVGFLNLNGFTLTKTGGGRLTLNNASNLVGGNGTLVVAAGTLSFGNNNTLNGLRHLTVNAGAQAVCGNITSLNAATTIVTVNGTVNLNARAGNPDTTIANQTIGALLGAGTVTAGGFTNTQTHNLTVGHTTIESAFSGVITQATGSVRLTKAQAAKLTLTGANTYSGTTTVNAGILELSGTGSINASSGLTVANGATFLNNSSMAFSAPISSLAAGSSLGGTGTFNNAVTIPAGVTLRPGPAAGQAGTMAFVNGLTLAGPAVFDLQGAAPELHDRVIVGGGTLNLGGTLTLNIGAAFAGRVGGAPVSLQLFSAPSGATFTGITLTGADSVASVVTPNSVIGTSGGTYTFNPATGILTVSLPAPAAPVINSPTTASGAIGVAFSYAITSTPGASAYSVTGALPAGVTLNTATGFIAGTPLEGGTFNVTLGATNAGGSDTENLTINLTKQSQAITFAQPADKQSTDAPFNLFASASSGLPVNFSITSGPATVSGTLVTLTGAGGVVTVVASQPGNNVHAAAPDVTRTFTVTAPPVITSAATVNGTKGQPFTYQITADNAPTGFSVTGALPAGLTLNPTTGLISGTPTVRGDFSVTIVASNDDGSNSAPLAISLQNDPLAPSITSAATATGKVGAGFSYQITTSNPATSFSVAGTLPAGLSLNPSTGLISGTPSAPQVVTVTINAVNASGDDSLPLTLTIQAAGFSHPGVFSSLADLNRMRAKVAAGEQPWLQGFSQLAADSRSSANYTLQGPRQFVGRLTVAGVPDNRAAFENDGAAVLQNAIMWYITGNQAHANKAIEILNAWSDPANPNHLIDFIGADRRLLAGIEGMKWIGGAEIIRHTGAGWSQTGIDNFSAMLRNIVYPVTRQYGGGNWGTAGMATNIAMGVFLDDQEIFDEAVTALKVGGRTECDNSISTYIAANGQNSETDRDQAHSQLGVAHLTAGAEIAWQQGVDLFSYLDNRLLIGMEYMASYNLGNSVPFTPSMQCDGDFNRSISNIDRGLFRPIYELVWNHYQNRIGIAAPFSQQVVLATRPEGYHLDHLGFGTLLHTLDPRSSGLPLTPRGLVSIADAGQVDLFWNASPDATSYNVKRATIRGGPFTTIASGVIATTFIDSTVTNETLYYYKVSAVNGSGETIDSGLTAAFPSNQAPSAPRGVTAAVANAARIDVAWNASLGATSYEIKRSTVSGGPYATVATVEDGAYRSHGDTGLSPSTTYYYVVTALNAIGQSVNSSETSATTLAALPSPWTSSDVGFLTTPGQAAGGGSSFTAKAAGLDIGGETDAFYFVHAPMTSDGTITARIASRSTYSQLHKSGLMMRETLAQGSRDAAIMISGDGQAQFASRTNVDSSQSFTNGPAGAALPQWLRLVRSGDRFTGYVSVDGANWSQVRSVTIPMAGSLEVGLAATSRNNAVLDTVAYDNVSVAQGGAVLPVITSSTAPEIIRTTAGAYSYTIAAQNSPTSFAATGLPPGLSVNATTGEISGTPTGSGGFTVTLSATNAAGTAQVTKLLTVTELPAPWLNRDLGDPAPAGNATLNGGIFTVQGSGRDLMTGTSANEDHHIAYQEVNGDCVFVARLTSITPDPADPNPNNEKIGIVMLENVAQGSRGTLLFFDRSIPATPVRLASRVSGVAFTNGSPPVTTLPVWMRLQRTAATITASYSSDGASWTAFNTVNYNTLPGTLSLGLAVTSRNQGFVTAATFDNVSVTTAVAAPTGLAAVAGEQQVALTWNQVPSAASYTVKRATTSGGPYLAIATVTGEAMTSYLDTTVARGTTYYYVVSATNAVAQSANSTQASAVVPALVILGNLSQTYDGTPKAVSATTDPADLAVNVTYTGIGDMSYGPTASAPVNAGNYAVTATVPSPIGGSATGTLNVAKAATAVTLDGLSQTYNGSPRVITATTNPAGLTVVITYTGTGSTTYGPSTTAPIDVGTYAVSAAVADPNYTGSATGTLNVSKAGAAVMLSGLSQTYDGSPRPVTATTNPAGLAVSISYNGSSSPPTNVGSYSVVATILETNYTGSAGGTLTISQASATITLGGLRQLYDGAPRPVTATTSPAGLVVDITYEGEDEAPVYPGTFAVTADIADPNYRGTATGTLEISTTALVRHAPTLNADVDGSVQMLLPESVTLNSNAAIYSDLLVPGTPAIQLNGSPLFVATQDGGGSASPSNYTVTLNNGAMLRYLVRRIDPLTMPTVLAPSAPLGTRNVTINNSSQSPGDFATLRNLTLNSGAGSVTVPPGTYGNFTANSGGVFVLGVANSIEPTLYNFQGLTLNSNSSVQVVGPVIITLNSAVSVNGSGMGASGHPEWLKLRLATGGLTLNNNVTVYGYITAPSGTITINGNSKLVGGVVADRLTLNGQAVLSDPEPDAPYLLP